MKPGPRQIPEERLIEYIQKLAQRLGRTPTQIDVRRDPGGIAIGTLIRRFGSWTEATRAAGLRPRRSGYRGHVSPRNGKRPVDGVICEVCGDAHAAASVYRGPRGVRGRVGRGVRCRRCVTAYGWREGVDTPPTPLYLLTVAQRKRADDDVATFHTELKAYRRRSRV